jgi:hypothetical protein
VYYPFWRAENPNVNLINPSAEDLRQSLADYAKERTGGGELVDAEATAQQAMQKQNQHV